MSRVKFGIYFDYYLDFPELKSHVLEAEALGYHSARKYREDKRLFMEKVAPKVGRVS